MLTCYVTNIITVNDKNKLHTSKLSGFMTGKLQNIMSNLQNFVTVSMKIFKKILF